MKAIYVENVKKFLKIEQRNDGEYYYCPKDNVLLFYIDKDGDFQEMNSCDHFEWYEIDSISYMQNLKLLKKYIIAEIDDDFVVYLLVPKLQ